MDITIKPQKLDGTVNIIPSKSQAHRILICAAFSDSPTTLICTETNQDIEATADCLRALGAEITRTANGYLVNPIECIPNFAVLPCRESGSTLRFMLPVVGALGVQATFKMEGRLPQRPLSPLWEEMTRMGCILSRPTNDSIHCTGRLKCGQYSIDGSVSSQFISGLLFALPLIPGNSSLAITGKIESKPYIEMTKDALTRFGVQAKYDTIYYSYPFQSPKTISIEGDWSNGAFFLTAQQLGCRLAVDNLNSESHQGDRAIIDILPLLKNGNVTVSAADIPDLVPIMSVAAAACKGATFTDIRRLRLKESDRVESTIAMIKSLGGMAEATEDTLTVYGTGLVGGTVDAVNDHRIAMSAAIAATVCRTPVTILGAECVKKSYPQFWDEYSRLGGKYELYIR